MSGSDTPRIQLPDARLRFDTRLASVLPASLAAPLAAADIETAEDLYECAASLGAGWFKSIQGIDAAAAGALMAWLSRCGKDVGEVTERFFLPGHAPGEARKPAPPADDFGFQPLERLTLPDELSGRTGLNRAPLQACALDAVNDLEAVRAWLQARGANPNTEANYRKEIERFLLWCVLERRTALSSVRSGDASLYLRWLEGIGRTDDAKWRTQWRIPQEAWFCPKNTRRSSPAWRPFNGPLSHTSRQLAVVVVRQVYSFLKKSGYLIFSPFDQVSAKVPLLKGEGVPKAFADRSLTEAQWDDIVSRLPLLPEGWPRERMKLILMMGKSLGMRASEMIDARTGWIVSRRIGFRERLAIEIVGKGAKVRRLPLNDEQAKILTEALAARGIPNVTAADPDTPLLVSLGRGKAAESGGMSRGGLYGVLKKFFDDAALEVSLTSPMDAAKLTAASTHWLRHTFAVNALTEMSVNVVQAAMGHASVATTGRYLSPEEETMSEAMAKMKAL